MKFYYTIWGINLLIWFISISMGYYLEKMKTNEEGFEKLDKIFGFYMSRIELALLPILLLSIFLTHEKKDLIVGIVGSLFILIQIIIPSLLILMFSNVENTDDKRKKTDKRNKEDK
ncbi:MAG: hypothetical protein Q4E02_05685 [Lagierella massiliensis]|nr:hypothetical protein [Lagierella massiliensis]